MTSGGKRTQSDLLFEAYLTSVGLCDFDFEPSVRVSGKRPDYAVRLGSETGFFEVMEFGRSDKYRAPWPNPARRIREKITKAQKQLRGLTKNMCAIVLADPRGTRISLTAETVYEAMLGDLAAIVPVDPCDEDVLAPLSRTPTGKMLRYRGDAVIGHQNTSISAICVLNFAGAPNVAEERREIRVTVYDNPYSTVPFPVTFPNGPYDMRYGPRDETIECTFAGRSPNY